MPSTGFILFLLGLLEADLPTMSTHWILHRLYSLDPSSLDFSRRLHPLIWHDEQEQYLSNLQGPELARLVDFLDDVRALSSAFCPVTKRICRPLVPFPPTTTFLENVYTNYRPSAVTTRSYRPHTSHLVKSLGWVMAQLPVAPSPMYGKEPIAAGESRSGV